MLTSNSVASFFHLGNTTGKVQGVGSQEFEFLIDTGSARTAIPRLNCQALGLRFAGSEGIEGMFGKGFLPLFDATLEIQGRPPFSLQIIGIEKGHEIARIGHFE